MIMEEEKAEAVAKNGDPDVKEETEEDGMFDESSFPELERTQTGRKTSIFKYYSFKEKGQLNQFVFNYIFILKKPFNYFPFQKKKIKK